MSRKIGIGALISGGGSNLQAIIDACESGKIPGTVSFVGSDNAGAGGLERAERHGIPSFVVDYGAIIETYRQQPAALFLPEDFNLEAVAAKQGLLATGTEKARDFLITRAVAEARLLDRMAAYPFDLLVLAGFMRNLTPYFIDRVNTDPDRPRIMNIHPAILPAFPGVDGYGDTFRYGCKVGGCTVHFIDYGEDTGPIIGQKSFAIEAGDTIERVREKGLRLEWKLYPDCVRLFAEGRLEIVNEVFTGKNGKTVCRKVVRVKSG